MKAGWGDTPQELYAASAEARRQVLAERRVPPPRRRGTPAGANAYLAEFGSVLRERRAKAGLTQQELAGIIGVSRTSINNMEQGRQDTTVLRVLTLAAALGCQPGDLFPSVENAATS